MAALSSAERARRFRDRNPGHQREYNRRYYAKHRERLNEEQRRRYHEGGGRERVAERTLERILARYGLSRPTYEALLLRGCAVCGARSSGKNRLHFDHDHETDRFRGLLCGNCNTSLGLCADDPERLRALADYLSVG